MKKILIVINDFSVGGTIACLESLLSVIDSNRVKCDIFARQKSGALISRFANYTILPENIWLSYKIIEGNIKQKIFSRFLWFIRGVFEILGIDMYKLYCGIGGKQVGTNHYDAVIGFDETLPRIISSYPAKKRISWLHCDYRRHVESTSEAKYFRKINFIVCVSEFAKHSFVEVLPEFEYKTVVIRNAINIKDIRLKSEQVTPEVDSFFKEDEKKFTLISIGRLDPVKQFEKIPALAFEVKRLLKGTHKFQWLIIGGGNDRVKSEIENEIEKYGVCDEVKLLGMQSNPYPYLAKSDLYVCTSLSETFSYTIHEGLALKKPFLCNAFLGASEAIQVGQEGFVLPLVDMPNKIYELICHPLVIRDCTISNDEILEKFYGLI